MPVDPSLSGHKFSTSSSPLQLPSSYTAGFDALDLIFVTWCIIGFVVSLVAHCVYQLVYPKGAESHALWSPVLSQHPTFAITPDADGPTTNGEPCDWLNCLIDWLWANQPGLPVISEQQSLGLEACCLRALNEAAAGMPIGFQEVSFGAGCRPRVHSVTSAAIGPSNKDVLVHLKIHAAEVRFKLRLLYRREECLFALRDLSADAALELRLNPPACDCPYATLRLIGQPAAARAVQLCAGQQQAASQSELAGLPPVSDWLASRVLSALAVAVVRFPLAERQRDVHCQTEDAGEPDEAWTDADCSWSNASASAELSESLPANQNPAPAVANQNPAPALANQNPAPSVANQNPVPSVANQNPAPALANQNPAPSVANQNPALSVANQNPAPALANQNTAPALANQNPAPALANQNPAPALANRNPANIAANRSSLSANQNPVALSANQHPVPPPSANQNPEAPPANHSSPGSRLLVRVIRASGLPVTAHGRRPVVTTASLELDEPRQTCQTRGSPGTTNPYWDEHFVFSLGPQSSCLTVRLLHQLGSSQPQQLCSASVRLCELRESCGGGARILQPLLLSHGSSPLAGAPAAAAAVVTLELLVLQAEAESAEPTVATASDGCGDSPVLSALSRDVSEFMQPSETPHLESVRKLHRRLASSLEAGNSKSPLHGPGGAMWQKSDWSYVPHFGRQGTMDFQMSYKKRTAARARGVIGRIGRALLLRRGTGAGGGDNNERRNW